MFSIMDIKETTGLTVREVAAACCLSVQAVYKWEKTGKVPAEHCRAIEFATRGKVTRYGLRPDVFGASKESECDQTREAA